MSTLRQIEANRRNAQKSTGPRTEAGKQTSRFNALKHAIDAETLIIPGEDKAALEALSAGYMERFMPQDPVEQYLLETLIHCDWLRRRLLRVQASIFTALDGENPIDCDLLRRAARRGVFGPDSMQRIYQQLASLDRGYLRALKELHRIQEERELMAGKSVSSPDASPSAPVNGFVPRNAASGPANPHEPSAAVPIPPSVPGAATPLPVRHP